jgi:hypothetical protein
MSVLLASVLAVAQITDSPAYPTAQEATVAALALVSHPTAKKERGGAILLHGGLYYYTNPVDGEEASMSFVIRKAPGDKLVALYHTHPVDPRSQEQTKRSVLFSQGDMEVAMQLHVLSYMYTEAGDKIVMFDPSWPDAARYVQLVVYPGQDVNRQP